MRTATQIRVSGSIPVTFADRDIPNPSFAGFVTTDNHGVLEFLLVFRRAWPLADQAAKGASASASGARMPGSAASGRFMMARSAPASR
jgi:hypothetical protein